jgi:hypothetical protein
MESGGRLLGVYKRRHALSTLKTRHTTGARMLSFNRKNHEIW